MRPKKIKGELKELIAQDIASAKPRKQICEERGVTYAQIAAEFGNVWKQEPVVQEASVN